MHPKRGLALLVLLLIASKVALAGPWPFQIKQTYAELYPLDVLGMPVMEGKTAVLNSGATNNLEYFSADIKEPNSPRKLPGISIIIEQIFYHFISLDG